MTESRRDMLARAQPHLDRGLSVADTAAQIGVTKGKLSGAMRRSRHAAAPTAARRVDDNSWEQRLRETWAERKARRAAERRSA